MNKPDRPCKYCKTVYPYLEFPKSSRYVKKDGTVSYSRLNYCKECKKIKSNNYYKKHRKSTKQYSPNIYK